MIKNISKNTIVTNAFHKKDFLGKSKGLIGKNVPETIVFKTRFGIHTFLLGFPIDLIIADKNNKVVIVKKNIKPNSIFFWNIKYDTVIELPFGSIDKSKTQKGDTLMFSL